MLWQILQAHGGKLPDDVVVCFQNTGLEHPKTYEFIRDVEQKWQVPIVWLELVVNKTVDDEDTNRGTRVYWYKKVDFCTAAKAGEPFRDLILQRKYLPNPMTRFCTVELKIRTLIRYLKHELGWEDWDNCIGLRADEPRRVAKMKGDIKAENPIMPMAEAGHTLKDVTDFWKQHDFDLGLPGGDNTFGNCVGCFLKGRSKLEKIMDSNPDHFNWWRNIEKEMGSTFRIDRPTYDQMYTQLTVQGRLFEDAVPDESMPCMCHD
jgi:3'-phosphoadenosine 5'-phosphosulfate sulfotransferase (PAPS reductase)/FAD synthetase